MDGAPMHPVVTKVVFETTGKSSTTGAAADYAAALLARTVRHLDSVDVGALVAAHLEVLEVPPAETAAAILRTTALVETVLDQCKSSLRTRMAMDLSHTLIPRLKESRS